MNRNSTTQTDAFNLAVFCLANDVSQKYADQIAKEFGDEIGKQVSTRWVRELLDAGSVNYQKRDWNGCVKYQMDGKAKHDTLTDLRDIVREELRLALGVKVMTQSA